MSMRASWPKRGDAICASCSDRHGRRMFGCRQIGSADSNGSEAGRVLAGARDFEQAREWHTLVRMSFALPQRFSSMETELQVLARELRTRSLQVRLALDKRLLLAAARPRVWRL